MPMAVLFDLYNTLVDGGDGDRDREAAAMAVDLGADPDRLAQVWRDSFPARCVSAYGDLDATIRAVAALAGARPTEAGVRLARARRLALIRRLLWPRPPVLATLDALRAAGLRTAVVSNCSVETSLHWRSTPLAERFGATAFSCDLRVAKPDPAIFLAACHALGVAPTECLFVGDGADGELSAAAALGMTVIQTEEYVPASGSWPRRRIATIGELVDLVSGPPGRSPTSAPVG